MSAEISSEIASFVSRFQEFFTVVVPWWVYLILLGAVAMATILGKGGAKKDVVAEKGDESATPTAKEFLEQEERKRQGLLGLGQTYENEASDGHPVDVEDRLISALIDAMANSQIVKGSRLSLIIDPSASKKLSLGAGRIDFELGPSIPKTESQDGKPPIPKDDHPEREEMEATA